MNNSQQTESEHLVAVKKSVQVLDNKYYSNITNLISLYIEEYFKMMHPELNQDKLDDYINLLANSWHSDLICVLLKLEELPINSFDSGAYID